MSRVFQPSGLDQSLASVVAIASAMTFGALAATARGQCEPEWLSSPAQSFPGVNGMVQLMTYADPDGPGLEAPAMMVRGTFTVAGNQQISKMALLRDGEWQPFGPSPNATIAVMHARPDGMYFGGSFVNYNGVTFNNIARWDGDAWTPLLGVGITPGVNGGVGAMLEHKGELVVGGGFTKAGGKDAHRIARWSGSEWFPIGWGMDGEVLTLAEYQGELYAGGMFSGADFKTVNYIARWDGKSWQRLGPVINGGVNGPVRDMVVVHGELVIAGQFNQAMGKPASKIARWDGVTMTPYQVVFDGPLSESSIVRLLPWGDDLYVQGNFFAINEMLTGNVGKFSKGQWSGLSGAYVYIPYGGIAVNPVENKLVIGGQVTIGTDYVPSNIVEYDGETFAPVGQGLTSEIYNLHEYNGTLIGNSFFAGLPGTPRLAQWDGRSWSTMDQAPMADFQHLIKFNGKLIAAGEFDHAGGEVVNNIAAWDGQAWSSLGNGLPAIANQGVRSLQIYHGDLIAGGSFNQASGAAGNAVARWDGTQWHPLGLGLTNGSPFASAGPMAVHQDNLFVLGNFTQAGGVAVQNLARWDGANWHAVSDQYGGKAIESPHTIHAWNGRLFMACQLKIANKWTSMMLEWDGQAWQKFTQADGGQFLFFGEHEDQMYCGSQGLVIAGEAFHGIMRWDGAKWMNLGLGLGSGQITPYARCFASLGDELFVGGRFELAGGEVSAYWARWGCPKPSCYPDCDESGGLNIDDFVCFQTQYALGDPGADCDASGGLNIDDFVCFQTLFAVGC